MKAEFLRLGTIQIRPDSEAEKILLKDFVDKGSVRISGYGTRHGLSNPINVSISASSTRSPFIEGIVEDTGDGYIKQYDVVSDSSVYLSGLLEDFKDKRVKVTIQEITKE